MQEHAPHGALDSRRHQRRERARRGRRRAFSGEQKDAKHAAWVA